MNTDGCPPGRFTDTILVYPAHQLICDGETSVWLGLTISLLIMRALLVIPQVIAKRKRMKNKQQFRIDQARQRAFLGCRIPIFLLTQVLALAVQVIFVTVTTLNIGSTINGLSTFLCGFYFVFVGLGHIAMARSVVILGRKIVPLSMKKVKSGAESFDELDKVDLMLKFMGFAAAFSIFLEFLFFLVSYAVGGNQPWTFQAAFVSVAVYQFTITVGIVHQFQRCMDAVHKLKFHSSSREADKAASDSNTRSQTGAINGERNGGGVYVAIRTMKIQQATTLVVGLAMCALSILIATFTVVLHYWLFCVIFMLVESMTQASLLFASVIAGRKHIRPAKQKPASVTNRVDEPLTMMSSAQPALGSTIGS